jgi:predicted Zn-dependent peptidase
VISELEQELTAEGVWSDQTQVAYETLYTKTVLAQSILGSKNTLKRMGASSLKEYHKLHYRKEHACLTVVTPLPTKEVMRRITSIDIPSRKGKISPTTSLPLLIPQEPLRRVCCIKTAAFTWELDFFFTFSKPKDVRESVALKLMSLVLFHSEISALFGEARKRGLVYMAYGVPMFYLGTSVYRVATNLSPAKADKFWSLFRRQIKKLMTEGLDAVFLEFCKAHFYYSRQVMLERYELYASKLVEKEFLRDAVFLPEEEIAALKSVTADDIIAMMHNVFGSDRRVVTIKGPDLTKKVETSFNKGGLFLDM